MVLAAAEAAVIPVTLLNSIKTCLKFMLCSIATSSLCFIHMLMAFYATKRKNAKM